MTALAERTVEVTPLGLRGRYGLTSKKQLDLYAAIVAHIDATGTAPTYIDMEAATDMTRQNISDRLRVLEDCRWIDIDRDGKGWMRKGGIHLVEPVLRHLIPAA